MSSRAACWSCGRVELPRRHPGQCAECSRLAEQVAARDAAPTDACLRCGQPATGSLCTPCGDAPDVWAIALEAANA